MKKLLTTLVFLLCSSIALAQWQVPNYSVPLGRGTGTTGFKRAAPGTTGLPLTSNGAAADPTFRQPISTSNENRYVSTAGSDAADGLSWATAKLTIQAAINSVSTYGNVYVGSGTFTLSAAIGMKPYMTLECSSGAGITQANGANLTTLIDFSGYIAGSAATGATIRNCYIDGNRANNTGTIVSGVNRQLIYFGNTDDVTIENNVLISGPGYGISGSRQQRLIIRNNNISDTERHAILATQVGGHFASYCKIQNNTLSEPLLVLGLDGCVITGNQIIGVLYGNTVAPMRVSVAGTAVTWVSGPDFSSVKTGYRVYTGNGAIQTAIAIVNSSTSLTLDTAAAAPVVNSLAMIGQDDLLGVGAANQTIIANNYVKNGGSYGISVFGNADAAFTGNVIANNIMEAQGINALGLLGDDFPTSGGLGARNNVITGNLAINSNYGGLAGCSAGASSCLFSYFLAGGVMTNVVFDGNHAQDDAGNTYGWLGISQLAAGSSIRIGNNNQVNAQTDGITGGVSSITLSSGWGSTAATSNIISYGNAVKFTVTANGAGIAATPTIAVNSRATKLSQGTETFWSCKMVSGSGTFTAIYGEQTGTPAAINMSFLGLPVAGSTYEILCV